MKFIVFIDFINNLLKNKMDLCNHLNNQPTYKIEGGLCMSCEKYNCYKCIDFDYYNHIFSKYSKNMINSLKNKTKYKFTSIEQLNKYKQDEMIAVCYNCVENINHPSIYKKLLYSCIG